MFHCGERIRVELAAALLIYNKNAWHSQKLAAILKQLLGLRIMASEPLQTALIRQRPTDAAHDLTRRHFLR